MARFGDAVNSTAATATAAAAGAGAGAGAATGVAGPGHGPMTIDGSGTSVHQHQHQHRHRLGAGVGVGVGVGANIVDSSISPTPLAGSASNSADTTSAPASTIKRRSPIACRRCRRMRSKCIHDKGQPPCKACLEAGLGAEDCIFPTRGQPDNDREFRHPRMRSEKASRRDPAKVRREILDAPILRTASSKPSDEWDRLPPLHDLVDGVNRFTRYYFQLGFIPKAQFPERLLNHPLSVSVFLVVSILSISARLTPALAQRYGSGMRAAEFFMDKAAQLAYGEIYAEPTLERCQAFYLLSIAQQGSELRNKSYINMGISMRMAALMQLHKEDTYRLENPTPDFIIRAESARRTLWMLHSQDQLHSGPNSPVSLAAADITALLPCSEADFALGREPASRAAVEDTPPALENPALITDPNRSLFASLMQAHHFWGIVGRRATTLARSSAPWDPQSQFALMVERLAVWEGALPAAHLWSEFTLKGYKSEGQDLAYLGVTMIPRLCNIIIRRPYLADIINLFSKPQADHHQHTFYYNLSFQLFLNVRQLFDQIDAQFIGRSPDESVGAQMAAFCVYSCGLFATYLCKYPHICPEPNITRDGPMMVHRTLSILMECKEVWPLATRWAESLEKFTRDHNITPNTTEGSMADGKDPVPHPVRFSSSSYTNPPSSAGASTHPIITTSINSVSPSSSSPSIYSRAGRSFEATPTSLQSPAEMIHPIPPQSISSQSIPTPMPHIIPSQYPAMPPPDQPFHAQQPQQLNPHMYIPADNSVPGRYSNAGVPNGVGMLIEAFDSTGQHPATAQGYDLSNGTPAAFYPTTDGFDGELQLYFDGGQEWFPNGVFDGYG